LNLHREGICSFPLPFSQNYKSWALEGPLEDNRSICWWGPESKQSHSSPNGIIALQIKTWLRRRRNSSHPKVSVVSLRYKCELLSTMGDKHVTLSWACWWLVTMHMLFSSHTGGQVCRRVPSSLLGVNTWNIYKNE
jgi:hypothetical protein